MVPYPSYSYSIMYLKYTSKWYFQLQLGLDITSTLNLPYATLKKVPFICEFPKIGGLNLGSKYYTMEHPSYRTPHMFSWTLTNVLTDTDERSSRLPRGAGPGRRGRTPTHRECHVTSHIMMLYGMMKYHVTKT